MVGGDDDGQEGSDAVGGARSGRGEGGAYPDPANIDASIQSGRWWGRRGRGRGPKRTPQIFEVKS